MANLQPKLVKKSLHIVHLEKWQSSLIAPVVY
jgi:hypothetical protein